MRFLNLLWILFVAIPMNAYPFQAVFPDSSGEGAHSLPVTVHEHVIEDATQYWSIHAVYPEYILESDTLYFQALNDLIKQQVMEWVADFDRDARIMFLGIKEGSLPENYKDLPLPEKTALQGLRNWNYTLGYENEVVSLPVVTLRFVEKEERGSNTPRVSVFTVNYDCRFRKSLQWDDVLDENMNIYAFLKKLCFRYLLETQDLPEDAPDVKNWNKYSPFFHKRVFDDFLISQEGIRIYFEPGVVAPRDEGIKSLLLPYQAFGDTLSGYFETVVAALKGEN